MRIAVTGAGGFVARHVLASLADHDGKIVATARRLPADLPANARFVPLELADANADVYDRLGRPDVLIHLAWGGLPNYRSHHHFEAELPLQYRFLRLMVEGGLPAMVVAGTCYEYGMVDGPLDEGRAPRPDNPYGFAKAALLRQLEFLQGTHGFALSWARLFYMWGEGQSSKSLWPLIKAAHERGEPTFPMSAGEQLRDYLPADEVGAMIAALALARADVGPINISSGEPVSIRALVERWIAQAGWSITPELGHFPYPDWEPMAFWGTTEKRRAVLSQA